MKILNIWDRNFFKEHSHRTSHEKNETLLHRPLLQHTYRCTNALASFLLCQQYTLRSPSNCTHSQPFHSAVSEQHDTLAPPVFFPLVTSSHLWNFLSSPLRSAISLFFDKICRNISDSLLLGQDSPVGFPNKTNKQQINKTQLEDKPGPENAHACSSASVKNLNQFVTCISRLSMFLQQGNRGICQRIPCSVREQHNVLQHFRGPDSNQTWPLLAVEWIASNHPAGWSQPPRQTRISCKRHWRAQNQHGQELSNSCWFNVLCYSDAFPRRAVLVENRLLQ